MDLTRITHENIEYFEHLMPDYIIEDPDIVRLGVINDSSEASCAGAVGISNDFAVIRWLYTDENHRGEGCGSELVNEIVKLAEEMNLKGVMADFTSHDEYVDTFFEDNNFVVDKNGGIFAVPMEDVLYSPEMEKLLEQRDRLRCGIRCENKAARNSLLQFMKENDIDMSMAKNMSPKYTVIKTDENGRVTGCIISSESGSDDLAIEYFINTASPTAVMELIAGLYDALIENDRIYGDFIFADDEGSGISLMEKLIGDSIDEYRQDNFYYALKLY